MQFEITRNGIAPCPYRERCAAHIEYEKTKRGCGGKIGWCDSAKQGRPCWDTNSKGYKKVKELRNATL